MKNKIASTAIVLGKNYYSDADAIVNLYTFDFGKISAIAKGIKKPKSRKRGNLETASLIKFSAVKSKSGLPILIEVESINTFSKIRSDLIKLSSAYYLLELVNKTSSEDQENIDLFFELKSMLTKINDQKASQKRRINYAKKILSIQGFWDESRDIIDLDTAVENLIERKLSSVRVAQKLLY